MATVNGTNGNDVPLTGTSNDDEINGFDGNDSLEGLEGNDTLNAGAGNDTLEGGAGADSLFGDAGRDVVDYSASDAGVDVSIVTPLGVLFGFGGHAEGDRGDGIEDIIGSDFNDTLDGNNAAAGNVLTGGAGDDDIDGRRGDDTLHGGIGNDSLFGGDGDDSLDGGEGNDFLMGDDPSGPGSAGNDAISGGSGNDTIIGMGGNDTLSGGTGDDSFIGGAGTDTIEGDAGFDTVDYSASGAAIDVTFGGSTNSGINSGGDAQGDRLDGIEGVVGSDFDDEITYIADLSGVNVAAGDGNDTISPFSGLNVGSATIDGGDGDDVITGGAQGDVLTGGIGNDTIDGGAGSDSLSGGSGDDSFLGGAGADTIRGGSGNDTVDYSASSEGVNIFLLDSGGTGTGTGGDAEDDRLTDIEVLIGSDFNDTLVGEADPFGSDTLVGNDGDDFIDGRSGDDSLSGGEGNDTLVGGLGNDIIDGGAGNDVFLGATGDDTITSGSGNDVFDINPNFGNDSYLDFTLNEDVFDASGIPSSQPAFPASQVRPGEIIVSSNPPDASFPGGSQTLIFPDGSTATVPAGTIRTDTQSNQIDDLVTAGIVCFTRGTLIATAKGDVPIETLKVGDKVITRGIGLTPLRWIGSRRVPAFGRFAPVMIKAGTLGNHEDLLVSQQHRMLITDPKAELMFGTNHVLVPAKHLVNDTTIYLVEGGEVEYWHILFDTHQIVYANGAQSESFHPSEQSISELEKTARDEVLELFPQLRDMPKTGYGPPAAMVLRKWEAAALLLPSKRPIELPKTGPRLPPDRASGARQSMRMV